MGGANGNGKLPWFPFFPKDYLSDDKVTAMNRDQRGSYMNLLCYAWMREPSGTLPDDDRLLAQLAMCTPYEWNEEKQIIMSPFFQKEPSGDWHQKRMEQEFQKSSRLHSSRAQAGSKGGASKARRLLQQNASKALAKPCVCDCDCSSGSISSEEVQEKPFFDAGHPTKEEFLAYGYQVGVSKEDCETLYDEWSAADWCSQEGKRIEKWRARILFHKNRNILPSQTQNKSNGQKTEAGFKPDLDWCKQFFENKKWLRAGTVGTYAHDKLLAANYVWHGAPIRDEQHAKAVLVDLGDMWLRKNQ